MRKKYATKPFFMAFLYNFLKLILEYAISAIYLNSAVDNWFKQSLSSLKGYSYDFNVICSVFIRIFNLISCRLEEIEIQEAETQVSGRYIHGLFICCEMKDVVQDEAYTGCFFNFAPTFYLNTQKLLIAH